VTVGIKVDIHGYHISLWFSNVFWKKTKYPPGTSVYDHWTQRKVTGKRKVTVDAEKSDGKKIRRP
jgi:hypothetical protein